MSIGFLWKWEPNVGIEVMMVSMLLALIATAVQLTLFRPRAALKSRTETVWVLLVVSPLMGVLFFAHLAGGLFILVWLFMEYIKRHGV